MAAPSGCKAPVSCLDHTDHGYNVKTLTLRSPLLGNVLSPLYQLPVESSQLYGAGTQESHSTEEELFIPALAVTVTSSAPSSNEMTKCGTSIFLRQRQS